MRVLERQELISIIVAIYNVESFLKKCLDSIIGQTYQSLEIILVDDGSTDGCANICDEYCFKDQRIKVYHKKNGGLSDARNYGIDKATGELLAFVDGDDWMHPQMYEILHYHMITSGSQISCCDFEREDDTFGNHLYDVYSINYSVITGSEGLRNINHPKVVAWNKLYRRELFKNLRYPLGRLHEDEFIIHKLFYQCSNISVTDAKLYFYTVRETSITNSIGEKNIKDSLDAFRDRIRYVETNKWLEVYPDVLKRYMDYVMDTYVDLEKNKSCDELVEIICAEGKKFYLTHKNSIYNLSCWIFIKKPKVYYLWVIISGKIKQIKRVVKALFT